MAIADNWQSSCHGFQSCHIISVFKSGIGGMNIESVMAELFLEILPSRGRPHIFHPGIVPDQGNR